MGILRSLLVHRRQYGWYRRLRPPRRRQPPLSYDSERAANRVIHTFETRQDALVEGDETFTVRTDPAGILDLNDPDRDEKCEITIIDDDPNITGVEVTSSPGRDNTYGLGETIEISATFSTAVDVNGTPSLGFWVGGTWQAANYLRGSGSNTLVFGYTVKSDDRDDNGISMDGGYQDSNGTWHNFVNHTTVTAVGTDTVAYRVYRGLGGQLGHKVNGGLMTVGTGTEISSSPASGGEYRYGETIEFSITFSVPLEVEGSRHLSLRVGPGGSSGWRGANYKSGSGTNTLVFGYTVQKADLDTDGVTMLGTWFEGSGIHGWGGSGTVKVKGTDVVVPPRFSGPTNQPGHKINGQPYPKAISITLTPARRPDVDGQNEIIQVSVNFDQNVTAGDDALAVLFIGAEFNERHAAYVSGNGADTLVFEYTLRGNDSDGNGVEALLPPEQDIKATGTEIAYQPNPGGVILTTGDNPDHKVERSL